MNRRTFIGSFAALAALAVTPSLAKLTQSDMSRLVAMMRTGIVQDQTFVLDGPIVIDASNLIINRCTFLFRVLTNAMPCIDVPDGVSGTVIENCVFDRATYQGALI